MTYGLQQHSINAEEAAKKIYGDADGDDDDGDDAEEEEVEEDEKPKLKYTNMRTASMRHLGVMNTEVRLHRFFGILSFGCASLCQILQSTTFYNICYEGIDELQVAF